MNNNPFSVRGRDERAKKRFMRQQSERPLQILGGGLGLAVVAGLAVGAVNLASKGVDEIHKITGPRDFNIGSAYQSGSVVTTGPQRPNFRADGTLVIHLVASDISPTARIVQISCDGTAALTNDISPGSQRLNMANSTWSGPDDACTDGRITPRDGLQGNSHIMLPLTVTDPGSLS